MANIRFLSAVLMIWIVIASDCGSATISDNTSDNALVRSDARVPAGGAFPIANALSKPRPAEPSVSAGEGLFGAMNCDGCHGGGAVGWVGPSLVDGRWRYGGSDEDVFTSIFYGRPKGMPAYGGVIGTDGVWMLVAYLKAQPLPAVVPTTSWLPDGNASIEGTTIAAAVAPAAAPEVVISPEKMLAKYGCTACHALDHKVVGPSFHDVAAKYHGQNVTAALTAKVKAGGSGVWGQIPMIPNPQVPDQDLDNIVHWILGAK